MTDTSVFVIDLWLAHWTLLACNVNELCVLAAVSVSGGDWTRQHQVACHSLNQSCCWQLLTENTGEKQPSTTDSAANHTAIFHLSCHDRLITSWTKKYQVWVRFYVSWSKNSCCRHFLCTQSCRKKICLKSICNFVELGIFSSPAVKETIFMPCNFTLSFQIVRDITSKIQCSPTGQHRLIQVANNHTQLRFKSQLMMRPLPGLIWAALYSNSWGLLLIMTWHWITKCKLEHGKSQTILLSIA